MAADEQQSLFNLAERFFNDSLYFSAADKYQAYIDVKHGSLKQNPENNPAAYYKIALCYFRTSNFSRAAAGFEEFIRLFPQDINAVDAMVKAAEAYLSLRDYKNASETFFRAWARGQGKPPVQNALFESAVCAEKDNDGERAVMLYDQYLNKVSGREKSPEASLSLVRVLIGRKDYARASAVLAKTEKQMFADGRIFVRALYYKAKLAHLLQKNENALRFYSALINQPVDFPEKEPALVDYTVLLKELRDYKTSLAVYKKLSDLYLKKNGGLSWEFFVSWAECAVNAGFFEAAENLYQQMLTSFPGDPRAGGVALKIAQCQVDKKDFSKAIETLQDLATGDCGQEIRAQATISLGDIYYDQGLFPNAVSAYRSYCGLPGVADGDRVLFKIAKTYENRDRSSAALREFERFLQTYPQSALYNQAAYAMAQCSEAVQDFPTALRYYDYLAQSNATSEIIDKAKKRGDYLKKYRGNNLASAVEDIAGLLQKPSDSIPDYERLLSVAAIYENTLDNFVKARDVYEQVAHCVPQPPDSILTRAIFCKAGMNEKIHLKALMENDSLGAMQAKSKALVLYRDVVKKSRYVNMADDAAFRILMLGPPSVSDYEAFVAGYPGSRHLIEVLLLQGAWYEKKAGEAHGAMNAWMLAKNTYTRIMRMPVSVAGRPAGAADAYLGLIRTYLLVQQLDSAQLIADEFLRHFTDSASEVEGRFLSGIIEKKRGNYSTAVEIFKKIFSRYAFSPFAQRSRCEMASALLASGKPQEALRNFRLYVQNYPGGEYYNEARLGIAQCLQRSGKNDEACQMLSDLLKEKCGAALTGGAYCGLAKCAKGKGDLHGALELLNKALSLDSFPDKGAVCADMGVIYFENSLYPDAARAFDRSLQYACGQADSIRALTGGLKALVMDGQGKKAEKGISFFKTRFGERHPGLAEVAYHKGLRFLVEKDYDKALGSFKYLIEKFASSPRADDAAYQTGLCYYYSGKQQKALEVFNDFITRYPESEFVPAAYFKIAMTHHDRCDFAQAAQLFEKVVPFTRADPKTRFRATYNAAIDYQKIGSWLDATRLYQTIVDSFPQEVSPSSTYLKIGFCCIQDGHFEDAVKKLQKAGASNPAEQEKPEILYWTATCYAKLGDLQKAVSEYLKVPSQYENARQWAVTSEFEAARICERLGDYKKAFGLYKKIILADGENGEIGKEALSQLSRLNIQIKEN